MATTPVDSGGTPSAPSPMVAVPGAREAPVILGTGIGVSMPKMECKINLRSGNQDAWRRWTVNRNDVITAHGLDALMDNQLMPTVEVIGERFPNLWRRIEWKPTLPAAPAPPHSRQLWAPTALA